MMTIERGWILVVAGLVVGCAGGSPPVEADDRPDTPGTAMEDTLADSTAIRPFQIDVPESVLDDLNTRLARTRFPDELDDVDWDYGTPVAYLNDLITYWQEEFDWRAQERALNAFDQYKTRIGDLDIHFIHQRSPEEDALPLIITHGWPGAVAEFMKIIGPLTDPVAHGGRAEDAFHVVAPSMPGYGFSDRPQVRGVGPEQVGDINAQLMERLGYERYGLQGGDWGAIVSRWHAFKHPSPVVGLHLNMLIAGPPEGVADPEAGVPEAELARMRDRRAFFQGPETGYSQIQGTKPQTLGYSLNDSPAGQAAWIVEKFRTWCDCDGNPENIFTRDELLTNIMLYWVTQTATSSARMYYESRHATNQVGRIDVPTGAAVFPFELFYTPRQWAEGWYDLRRWTEMPRGGHFAAMEQPELFVDDVRAFFAELR
jgi:pimeloyl-ACP methyl ester carboxylesterase